MFEDMWDDNDLEFTQNRLRVHVLTLKKKGDPYPLMRLYGPLALVLALRGDHNAAQDALNDAEFLLVEHGWRGTEKEAWVQADRARVMLAFGRPKWALRAWERALSFAGDSPEPALRSLLENLREKVGASRSSGD